MKFKKRWFKDEWSWWDYICDWCSWRPDWWWNVKNYLRNFKLFNRLAWEWRVWDTHYTICVLIKLLIENGRACKNGNSKNGFDRYRKAMCMAGQLEKAYNYNCTDDRCYMYLVHKYPYDTQGNILRRDFKNNKIAEKMYEIASNRVDETEKKLKKEAWEYVSKYIEYIWD